MKNILKYAVVLLILFAMIGTASAAVSGVQANVENNADNYNVIVTWTGTLTDPATDVFTITINGESFSGTTNDTTYTFSNIALIAGNSYTATVEDDEGATSPSPAFTPQVAPPVLSPFKSVTTYGSNDYTLTWTWSLAGNTDDIILQYNNSGTWSDVSAKGTDIDPLIVTGSPAQTFEFRSRNTSSDVNSTETTKIEFKSIVFSDTPAADSITWSVSNWDSYEYNVTKTSDGVEVISASTNNTGTIVASGLDANTEYTLNIRGINSTYGQGLWTTNNVTTTAASSILIDSIEPAEYLKDKTEVEQGTFTKENGTTLRLNITSLAKSDYVWTLFLDKGIDGTDNKTSDISKNETSDDGLKNEFEWKPSKTGDYILTLEIKDVADPAKTQKLSWKINVPERSTGSRIWQEGMPTTYTWDARSFSGFYYNLDTGQGDESMTIRNIGRSIDKGDLTYQTTTSETDYEYEPWGTYEIVGFMGDKYFAGDSKSSLMKNGNLSKVLVDTDDTVQLRTGQNYALEEGYSITVQQIDINGGKAQIVFSRDGKEVGSYITNEGETASYYKNVGSGSGNNTTFIKTRVKSVFQGSESAIVEVEGIFQISDNLTRLEDGTKIGKMEITSVTNDRIEMENEERISLSQDSEIDLMGKVKIVVADSGTLRFAPVMEYTEPGVYEIRGTVSDYSESDYIIYEWDPRNFEGFYYDINDDVESSEKIKINQSLDNGSRSIDKGNLEYSSNITTVDYNYSAWGDYSVVGFMGEKYYAGLGGSLLKDGNLSKVLVDTDEKRNMRLGDSLVLEDGISIKIEQIDTNGNKARLLIEQNGKELSSGIVSAGEDLVYNGSNSKIKDTPFIKVHVDSVFMGTESSIVSITGVFQASMNLTKLDTDTKYGKMKVDGYTSTGISLSSDERITLSQGNDVDFMKVGNDSMYFKVGDSNTLRFAPIVERTIGSTDPLTVKLNSSNVTSGDAVLITLNDRGTTIEGVTVYVNGSQIGTTNSSGEITYTTNAVGSFKVTGEKAGYVNGSTTLNVAEKLINMTVRVSPETVYFGTPATIKATDSLNGSALSGATVYISGESVGTTDSSGELNYTFNKNGLITVDVSKSGYNNGTTSVNISQKVAFAYSNFALKPDEPSAKKAIKLSIDITNNGIEDGSHDLNLVLTDNNGNVIAQDNDSVSIKVGKSKSVTLSVKAPESGTYKLTLKEADSGRTIDLPASLSTISVGEAKAGSTILYVILGAIAVMVIAAIGFVAYLFGIKGATTSNYKEVAGEVASDIKSKFKK